MDNISRLKSLLQDYKDTTPTCKLNQRFTDAMERDIMFACMIWQEQHQDLPSPERFSQFLHEVQLIYELVAEEMEVNDDKK